MSLSALREADGRANFVERSWANSFSATSRFENLITRPVHHSHAALANLRKDSVVI
jgi:hypothetical protein